MKKVYLLFIVAILTLLAPWWIRHYYKSDIMFAAFFLGGMIFLASFIIFLNVGKRMEGKARAPKLIVDNFKKKQAPFHDATGAHAGALLGDVLHDRRGLFPVVADHRELIGEQAADGALQADMQKRSGSIGEDKLKDLAAEIGEPMLHNASGGTLPEDEAGAWAEDWANQVSAALAEAA